MFKRLRALLAAEKELVIAQARIASLEAEINLLWFPAYKSVHNDACAMAARLRDLRDMKEQPIRDQYGKQFAETFPLLY